jgi:hypothetical protein
MKKILLKKIMLLTLTTILCVSTSNSCSASTNLKPTWLKEGVFASYDFGDGVIETYNQSKELGFDFSVFSSAKFRWECIVVNDTFVNVKTTLSFFETSENGIDLNENKTKVLNGDVEINLATRGVYSNSTLVGTTRLWLPSNPALGEEVTLWDVPPYMVSLQVDNRTSYAPETPQGVQKVFEIEGSGKAGGPTSTFTMINDFDTGILVDGGLDNEGTMRALNVRDFSYNGRMIFSDTNVDLGPSDKSTDLTILFPIIAIPVAITIIFIMVYKGRKKGMKKKS